MGKAPITSGLHLRRSEVLRSLKHYLQAQSQGHHTINHLDERCWKEEALNDLPWKDEKRQQSVRRTLKLFQRQLWANLTFLRDEVECTGAFLCAWIPSWTGKGVKGRKTFMEVNYIHYPQAGWGAEGKHHCPGWHCNLQSQGSPEPPGQWSLSERLAVFMCLSLPLLCIVHICGPVITIIMHCCIFMGLSLPLSCIVVYLCACHYYYHVYSCACHYHYHVLLYIHVPVSPNTIIMYLIYRCVDTRNSHEDKLGHPSTEQAAEEHDEQETHQGCQVCRCQFCCLGFILSLFLFFCVCVCVCFLTGFVVQMKDHWWGAAPVLRPLSVKLFFIFSSSFFMQMNS